MDDLKVVWQGLDADSDFAILVLLWAIACYLVLGRFQQTWSEWLRRGLFQGLISDAGNDSTNAESSAGSPLYWLGLALFQGVNLLPFLLLGLVSHLFFLRGFGHIWSVSLALLGCIVGGLAELVRQNGTLG